MKYLIEKATNEDLSFICQLYDEAIQFQKNNQYIGWDSVDRNFLKQDIAKGLLYKVMTGANIMVAVFSICYSDSLIWREKEKGDALYIHRVALNQVFRGEKIFKVILEWANTYAASIGLLFIRIDTWANNAKLIAYYQEYDFHFVENYTTDDAAELPVQHRNLQVALLEYCVKEA